MDHDGSEQPPPGTRVWRRIFWAVAAAALVVVLLVARPGWHLWRVAKHDIDVVEAPPAGFADDASRLNLTPVREVRRVPADRAAAEQQLRELLSEAVEQGWKISIAGARHSMGGHTIYPGGIVLDMLPLAEMALDESTNTLRVGAGALWSDVLAYLDRRGRSIGVMQSNNSFTVGGSISVNCHGWQVRRPPIASTVQSLRLMLADGSIARPSRREDRELFSAVLGGYGLFGIILDVELAVVPNRRYRLERYVIASERLPDTWAEAVAKRAGAEMVYGRLNVTAERFLQDSILYVLYVDPSAPEPIPPMESARFAKLKRQVFRGSAENEYGKRLRWQAELNWQPKIAGSVFSRNQLLNEGVEVFQNRSAETTDILHEYFVPHEAFAEFVARVRQIVPSYKGNLLNVTVRGIETDGDTLLRYADRPMLALVMLFQQPRSREADATMAAMTRELIEASLDAGGRYYLPYRLHATAEQFRRAYPAAEQFFALKRKYDPQELFQNQFYLQYGIAAPPQR
jgi:FAD/FMN-containing dehydrogenase